MGSRIWPHLGGDHQPILPGPEDDPLDDADPLARLVEDTQPRQILRPELTIPERSTLIDRNIGTPDLFRSLPAADALECNLETTVDATNRPHHMRTVLQIDGRTGLEADRVLLVDVDP